MTFVSSAASGALFGLFIGIGGEHAECDRQPGLERHLLQSPSGLARDVIEMRRIAPDHCAQSDDRVVTVTMGEHFGSQGKLERPRNVKHFKTVGGSLLEGFARSLEQLFRDCLVEARYNDREL